MNRADATRGVSTRAPARSRHAGRRRSWPACLLLLAIAGSIASPQAALAWGPSGHRIAATLAERQLDKAAHREVLRLLALSGDATLADVANWADEVRADPHRGERTGVTKRMHFINFADATCRYDATRICADGQCAVAAIEANAAILGDRRRADADRAQALRLLVHFVADVHQPLHASYRADRGGNLYQVRIEGKGDNLHSVWDSRVLGSRGLGWQRYASRLERLPALRAGGGPVEWAEESCRIVRDAGMYPSDPTIGRDYLVRMRPLAERQLRRSAARLAMMINRLLD